MSVSIYFSESTFFLSKKKKFANKSIKLSLGDRDVSRKLEVDLSVSIYFLEHLFLQEKLANKSIKLSLGVKDVSW